MLEQVCCRNGQKPVTGLGNKDPLKVLNGTKLMLGGQNDDDFSIINSRDDLVSEFVNH